MLLKLAFLSLMTGSGPAFSDAKSAEKNFWEKTGFIPGIYERAEGTAQCQQGELAILTTDNHLTLELGAHALIFDLGEKTEVKEQGCVRKFKSDFSKGIANGEETNTCGKKVRKNTLKLTKNATGITYIRTHYENGVLKSEDKCALKPSTGEEKFDPNEDE